MSDVRASQRRKAQPGGRHLPVNTVLGPIAPHTLGPTTMHEHLLIDVSAQYSAPVEPPPEDATVSLGNLGYIRWNVNGLRDNLVIDDAALVADELADMTALGASGLVDLTVEGLGPQVDQLLEISTRTGLH